MLIGIRSKLKQSQRRKKASGGGGGGEPAIIRRCNLLVTNGIREYGEIRTDLLATFDQAVYQKHKRQIVEYLQDQGVKVQLRTRRSPKKGDEMRHRKRGYAKRGPKKYVENVQTKDEKTGRWRSRKATNVGAARAVDEQAARLAKMTGPPPQKPKKRGVRVKKAQTVNEKLAQLDAALARA
jgi:hypothetical protein